ncbi:hypothetical protein DRO55_00305, partial [Candidatus Bathyarchaeota archaeon]
LLCTRVTPVIKEAVQRESQMEGLTTSEWLRNLIVKELKERGHYLRFIGFQPSRGKRPKVIGHLPVLTGLVMVISSIRL